jgi:hypothetical protein
MAIEVVRDEQGRIVLTEAGIPVAEYSEADARAISSALRHFFSHEDYQRRRVALAAAVARHQQQTPAR